MAMAEYGRAAPFAATQYVGYFSLLADVSPTRHETVSLAWRNASTTSRVVPWVSQASATRAKHWLITTTGAPSLPLSYLDKQLFSTPSRSANARCVRAPRAILISSFWERGYATIRLFDVITAFYCYNSTRGWRRWDSPSSIGFGRENTWHGQINLRRFYALTWGKTPITSMPWPCRWPRTKPVAVTSSWQQNSGI